MLIIFQVLSSGVGNLISVLDEKRREYEIPVLRSKFEFSRDTETEKPSYKTKSSGKNQFSYFPYII
jgi:ACT domain-containing protein